MRRTALTCAAAALAACTVTGAVPAAALATPAASAQPPPTVGPVRTAWYDASYPQPTPTPPPGPPGVGADELVVSGVTASTSVLPVAPPSGPVTGTQPTALTALLFQIPAGATPATLTLPLAGKPSTSSVDGKLPVGVTPEACPAAAAFTAGGHQPWSAVPAYDCTGRTSTGQLSGDGTAVVFSDIGSVGRGKTLSVVIRSGTLGGDRLVFAKPTGSALSLLSFDAAPSYDGSGKELLPSAPLGSVHPSTEPAGSTPAAAPSLPSGPLRAGSGATTSSGAAAAQPPAVAPGTPGAPPAVAAQRAAVAVPDDTRTRLALLAGLVLLLQAGVLLMLTDQRDPLVALWGVWRAVRDGEPLPQLPAKEWGVGRHRAPRRGPAPLL